MSITTIHTYLVRPNKLSDVAEEASGTEVPTRGPLFGLLTDIYDRSDKECDIDITFRPSEEGTQQNDCRDLICRYVDRPSLECGRKIAERLGRNTDKRSGLGLLFLMAGSEDHKRKLVVSRFPTDVAVYVDEDPSAFTVEFLERVFMKNKASYKAVVYRDSSVTAGFWRGRATDRQLKRQGGETSNYWIVDFLASQFTATPKAGTRRLAIALRDAAKSSELGVKREINAAATLADGLSGETLSVDEFGERFRLSQRARDAISGQVRSRRAAEERFMFDAEEFGRTVSFRTVEVSNGAMLTASASVFDDVFTQELVDVAGDVVRFTTEGSVVDEKLRARA